MIYQKCTNETSSYFYNENNINTRKHFIELLYSEIKTELEDFSAFCSDKSKDDMLMLYEEIYVESVSHLDAMQESFIENNSAHLDDIISLNVFERALIC